jgi:putative transposase
MKTSRFSDSQIIAILKQAEGGSPVPELCREHGISSAKFYKWRSKFGGMDASLMARLKELEDENRRLKKMYAEERLKAEIVQEALQKSGEAILPTRDGATNRREWRQHPTGLPGLLHQLDLLPLPLKAVRRECRNRRPSDPPDP